MGGDQATARRHDIDHVEPLTLESTLEVLTILDRWCQTGVGFVALEQGIDTATTAGRMVCQMLAAVAEFERALIGERTTAALTAAAARGIKGGRPTIMTTEKLAKANKMLATGQFTLAEAAHIGVSRTTLADHRRRQR